MFLDDELLKMCKDANISVSHDVQQLNSDLCKKCESHYKSKLDDKSAPHHIKITLKKTFNLWDSFVRMAKKDEDKTLNILGDLFEEFSFKNQFLKNEEINRLYQSL